MQLRLIGSAMLLTAALGGPAPAVDLSAIGKPAAQALQLRLARAGCYHGPIDGAVSLDLAEAVEACPDQDPILRIEAGMHIAPINRIGVDAACKLMVTGSADKTVRLWSMPEGRPLQVIRLPIGEGNGGRIDAVAISPDGHTIAAGGWDAAEAKGRSDGIYVVDLDGGVRRFGGLENVIHHIAFSPDGKRVAVGLAAGGVRVFDRDSGKVLMADKDYGADVYGVAFARDGSLYATSYDGFLRRYSASLKPTAKVKAPGGHHPYTVAASPDGRRIAMGYEDKGAVAILDAATLKLVAAGQTGDLKTGALWDVVWRGDGRQILAGGSAQAAFPGFPKPMFILRRLDPQGRRAGPDLPAADSTMGDLKPCGTGIALASLEPAFGLVDGGGKERILQRPVTADMRDKTGDALTIAADASVVRFGLGEGAERPVRFDLAAGTLEDAPKPPSGLDPAIVTGLPVAGWLDGAAPTLGGRPLPIEQNDFSRALAIRPDRSGFVLATSFGLTAFDANGARRWSRPTPNEAWGVAFRHDGEVMVVACGDGTIRWYRWVDGTELLALFVHAPSKRWVAWTPTGYYMASPGGEDLIGWHLNRGWEQRADFFPASHYRDRFNRPDVVRLILTTLDEAAALKQADAARPPDNKAPDGEEPEPALNIRLRFPDP